MLQNRCFGHLVRRADSRLLVHPYTRSISTLPLNYWTTLTIRYPAVHPVTNMLSAMLTFELPNTWPATVGMSEKNPPAAKPLTIEKAISGERDVETVQRANMLIVLRNNEAVNVLRGPILSLRKPDMILPIADEKLKPATSAAPVAEDRPIDVA